MTCWTTLAVLCLFVAGGHALIPIPETRNNLVVETRNGDTSYRLDESVTPHRYLISLQPNFPPNGGRPVNFIGDLIILASVNVPGINQIVLHAFPTVEFGQNNINIVNINTQQPIAVTNLSRNNTNDFVFIGLGQELPANANITVRITFSGEIFSSSLSRGLYSGSYHNSNNEIRWFVTTQLEATHARKVFPCFDEPALKSTFELSVTRPGSYSPSISNTQIAGTGSVGTNLIIESFERTARMPVYLLTLLVSDFVEIPNHINYALFSVVARSNAVGQAEFALEIGQNLTRVMGTYVGLDYYDLAPRSKLDHVALPDFPSGAMENWGMVNYREAYLLVDANNTNVIFKEFVAAVMSHEIAHMWFGNLVTCHWWSNIWLNEAFASYFEYILTHMVLPEYHLDLQIVTDYVHQALLADSSAGSPPMNNPSVNTPEQISAHFGTVTYAKGAAVLRMTQYILTERIYAAGLNQYLITNAYEAATPDDYYAAVETAIDNSGIPPINTIYRNIDNFSAIMRPYIDQPGYPVLNVDIDMSNGNMRLTQNRFFLTQATSDDLWPIPITFTTGVNPDWFTLTPRFFLTDRETTVNKGTPDHEWVVFNVQQTGYYRVNYDEHSWEMIGHALKEDHTVFHVLNRAQIVDDLLNLARASQVSYLLAFEVLDYLRRETEYIALTPAISGFNWLRRRFLHQPQLLGWLDAYALNLTSHAIDEVGYIPLENEDHLVTKNRLQLLNHACQLGETNCVENALSNFDLLKNSNTPVDANIRPSVYCTALRNGTEEDWDFLWDRYFNSNVAGDQLVILRALGCTRHQNKISQLLANSLNPEMRIRVHDTLNVFTFVLLGNQDNVQTAFEFVQNNYNAIRTVYGGSDRLASVLSTLANYMVDRNQLDEFELWINDNIANLVDESTAALNGAIAAREALDWTSTVGSQVAYFLTIRFTSVASGLALSFALLFTSLSIITLSYAQQ